jgi:bidirectional [NiFe] hydrogenase diaphorase subunit
MITDLHQPWGESRSCTSCAKCVHVCPTGALSDKGCAAGEMVARDNVFPYLTSMRGSGR